MKLTRVRYKDWANADHAVAANALLSGLSKHPSERPGFLIHTSGTGVLAYNDIAQGSFGIAATKVYNDWDGVSEVTSIPDAAPHRVVDKIVLAGHEIGEQVKTAIVCPSTIYGVGRGPDNTRSVQTPRLGRATLQSGYGIRVGQGENIWNEVHVHDLSNLYLLLVEEAGKGGGKATWGPSAYYFAENGPFAWGEVAAEIARVAKTKKWISNDEVKVLTAEEVEKLSPHASVLWGTNSRSVAERARRVLGWHPVAASLMQEIPGVLEVEARSLGMIPGHAAEAGGLK